MNSDVGIVEFLSMHYWGTDLNDNDQDKDMKLPFKKVDAPSASSVAIPIAKTTIEKQQIYTPLISQHIPQDLHLTNPALSSLFRPPRV